MNFIKIIGTGSYVPSKVLTNKDLQEMGLDTTDEWIVKRTGISERRVAEPGVAASDLAVEASKKALEMAGMGAEDLDLIIMGTITPDTCCPAGANWLEGKLGAHRAISFDITAACSGFVFAMDVAIKYMNCGAVENALVVGSEILTRVQDWTDRTNCVLWGDGAGAAIITKGGDGHQVLSTHIHTDGANGQDLLVPGGGSATTPISHESVDKGLHSLRLINANASFRVAVRRFVESIEEAARTNNISVDDIDWFIPHQANQRMFNSMAKTLNIPMEKFYITINKYGNISSASCIIAFDEAVRDRSIKDGDIVCLPVFGGGLTWGSALIKW
ncbi:MAG: ketoacyl-ACP synthase III [Deltaproteobacteria bacterium]|nr:ketoacyl-ACP synthase III [Deltaproteobacteria bacterium]